MALYDLPDLVNSVLGLPSGDVTGGLVMSIGIVTMIGLVLAVAKIELIGIAVVLISVVALLTAIGWLPIYLMVVIILLVSALFAKQMADWLRGD